LNTLGLPVGKVAKVDIFYAERHTPWATFQMTTNIFFDNSLGNVGGDPHFTGLSGEEYDVMGEPDQWFNLVSDVNFQLNAYFVKGCASKNFTAIGALAMLVGDQRIFLNLTCDATLNETVSFIDVGSVNMIGPNGKYGYIHHILPQVFNIDTPDYYMSINPFIIDPAWQTVGKPFYGTDCIIGYFNIQVELTNDERTPHGLLGQTAHHIHSEPLMNSQFKEGEGEIEGVYTDYRVSGMYGTDFKYNRYSFIPNFEDNYEDLIEEGVKTIEVITESDPSGVVDESSEDPAELEFQKAQLAREMITEDAPNDPIDTYYQLVTFYETQCKIKNGL